MSCNYRNCVLIRFTNLFQIPVNKSHHWSLCVIVNPGAIRTSTLHDSISSPKARLFPCFLFFDSLGLHKKVNIANKLRGWLNAEWKRKRNDKSDPFTEDSMKMYTPKGKSFNLNQ
jgi:Ulp1 family protease